MQDPQAFDKKSVVAEFSRINHEVDISKIDLVRV